LHKNTIIGTNTSHHGSYGLYYADGLKASYQKLDESQSSISGRVADIVSEEDRCKGTSDDALSLVLSGSTIRF